MWCCSSLATCLAKSVLYCMHVSAPIFIIACVIPQNFSRVSLSQIYVKALLVLGQVN